MPALSDAYGTCGGAYGALLESVCGHMKPNTENQESDQAPKGPWNCQGLHSHVGHTDNIRGGSYAAMLESAWTADIGLQSVCPRVTAIVKLWPKADTLHDCAFRVLCPSFNKWGAWCFAEHCNADKILQ